MFLQNASASGPDPFTKSTATATDASQSPAPLPTPTESVDANTTRSVNGSAAGLYGGSRNTASCNVEQQIRFLADEPAKNAAFASVLGITAEEVPDRLRSLTPLQLRVDTRVTNHGFRGGSATSYQAVLQAGTAVLVDDRGVPRVRCACGNPLTPPVAQKAPKTTGTAWSGYRANQVVVVSPSTTVVNIFVVYDPKDDGWFAREPGDTGKQDKPTSPPTAPPSPSVSDLVTDSPTSPPPSPVPCVTVTGGEAPKPRGTVTPTPCPSDSASTSSPAPKSPDAPSPQSEPATGGTDTGGTTTNGTTGTTTDGTTDGTTDRSASVESPQTSVGSPQPGPQAQPVL
ncbi:DUF6777 domain-containing protein [Streptomyces sp. NPDC002992]|uniref:DUF6777 domain-containing protein n=1 Tax=Streptomyces sp. NPDC002992 TaxID=3154273 RepID=UPI0033B6C2F7